MSRGTRLAARSVIATSLARYSDRRLREIVDAATPAGSGIGGKSALLYLAGTPVFVKQVPLTDLEKQPANLRSTANLFGLPAFCHYGIGSPGFGAWRELAAHTITTKWVLAGDCEGFPLMYHWRVLSDSALSLPAELADAERDVAYWGGGAPVRQRIEALAQSRATLTLFLEYIPQNLHQWLGAQVRAGDEAAGRACVMVERELEAGTSFMNAHGLLHFDAHFENILTDGERLFFADYGLTLSAQFDLAPDETSFFHRHLTYDRTYTVTQLVNWLATNLCRHEGEERDVFVRACATGERPSGIPGPAAEILARHAPLAAVMTDFYRRIQQESRQTPYPLEEIRRVSAPYSWSG